MKFLLKAVLTCGFFVLLSPAISAQTGPASVSIALQMRTGYPYKTGSPYCATKEVLPPKTPPDRTNVAHGEMICRDSLGRGREGIGPALVEIYDPVEGFAYTLDTVHHRAGRTVITGSVPPNSTALPRIWGLAAGVLSPAVESLGTDVIEGLVVEGARSPNGLELLAKGEEEIWFSRELGEVIVTKVSDGLKGSIVVYQLTHIDRSEPDPSLFRVPANYTISDTPDFGDVPSSLDAR